MSHPQFITLVEGGKISGLSHEEPKGMLPEVTSIMESASLNDMERANGKSTKTPFVNMLSARKQFGAKTLDRSSFLN